MMKAAVIGCGRMGAESSSRLGRNVPSGWLPVSHAESIIATPDLELAAFCDTNEELLEARGAAYGVRHLFTSYKDLIDTIRPDLVTVATRTPVKGEIIEYACSRGVKGLYIEKPIANSLAQCQRVLASVTESGATMYYGVNRRYHTMFRQARQMLMDGQIGDVIEVGVAHGEAQLLWTHPHSVDLIQFLLNTTELVDVQARLTPGSMEQISSLKIDSDPIVQHAFFRFANGTSGTLMRSRGAIVTIGGSSGTLTILGDGAEIHVRRHAGNGTCFRDEQLLGDSLSTGATVTAMIELAAIVRTGIGSTQGLRCIEGGLRMLMGCVWSELNGGQAVRTADIPAELTVTGRFGHLFA